MMMTIQTTCLPYYAIRECAFFGIWCLSKCHTLKIKLMYILKLFLYFLPKKAPTFLSWNKRQLVCRGTRYVGSQVRNSSNQPNNHTNTKTHKTKQKYTTYTLFTNFLCLYVCLLYMESHNTKKM